MMRGYRWKDQKHAFVLIDKSWKEAVAIQWRMKKNVKKLKPIGIRHQQSERKGIK